jgi:hypothetical protein
MQDNVANLIRSFGMSGFLVTEELKTLEQRYNVELGHTTRAYAEDQTDYYPQFEHSVRSEAADMSSHYELFYCLETSIRKLITETLAETDGSNWWGSGRVPSNVATEVNGRIQRELDSGMTRNPTTRLTTQPLASCPLSSRRTGIYLGRFSPVAGRLKKS